MRSFRHGHGARNRIQVCRDLLRGFAKQRTWCQEFRCLRPVISFGQGCISYSPSRMSCKRIRGEKATLACGRTNGQKTCRDEAWISLKSSVVLTDENSNRKQCGNESARKQVSQACRTQMRIVDLHDQNSEQTSTYLRPDTFKTDVINSIPTLHRHLSADGDQSPTAGP